MTRFLPLLVLGGFTAIAISLDLHHYLTLDSLKQHRQILQAFVDRHILVATLSFFLLYTLVVALSLPGATIMTVASGMLFGTVAGGLIAVLGATFGAMVVFLAAKFVIGDFLLRKAGPFIQSMDAGFRKNAFSYLLFLRLVPVFPFWVVNLVPAFSGVPLRMFAAATTIGIIPGTVVFAAFGAGVGEVFDAGQDVSLGDVLSPTLLAAFAGLGILALIPVVIRKWRGE